MQSSVQNVVSTIFVWGVMIGSVYVVHSGSVVLVYTGFCSEYIALSRALNVLQ